MIVTTRSSPIKSRSKGGRERGIAIHTTLLLLMQSLFLLLSFPLLLSAQRSLTEILRRSDRSRYFDTLTEIVHDEYKDKTQSSDQVIPVQYQRREASIVTVNEKLQDILYEGDILVTAQFLERVVDSSLRRQGNRVRRQAFLDGTYPMSIWTEGVPYVLHPSLSPSSRASIQRAINFWHEETCINFRPRTTEVQYINFIGNGDGCWSSVGKDTKSGPQPVSIGAGCSHFGVTSHELAHALGLFHEQSRYDRDRFVTLNTNRVPRRLLYNFAKIGNDELTTYSLPYDVGSVMHYAPTEFAIDRRFPALTAVDPNLQFAMGNLYGPTFVDVALLNVHYNCANVLPLSTVPMEDSLTQGSVIDASESVSLSLPITSPSRCPSGFGGRLCDEVDVSFSQNCGGIVQVGEDVRRFTITIRQNMGTREKECVYHFVAPQRRRILINVLEVNGTCVEGCHLDTAEFKMVADLRPVGYRVCCNEQRGSRLVSVGNIVPAIFQSTRRTYTIRFEYTLQAVRTKRMAQESYSDMQETIVDVVSVDRDIRYMRSSSFYYDISGEESERLLIKYGRKGDFLARPSESQPNNYTLSINRGGTVTHVKVQRNGDTLDLLGGESFLSLTSLIQHYIENPEQLKEKNGETIYMLRPVNLPREEMKIRRVKAAERWFHRGINGVEATQLLAKEKQWSFLVRESQRTPGQMAISVKVGDDLYKHIMLERNPQTGRVHVGGGDEFNSINDLLAHYRKNPLVEEGTQNVVRLTNMLPSTSVPVEAFHERMTVLARKDETIGGIDGFAHEFNRLNEMDDSVYSRRDGKLPYNADKNRYKNIVPYDHTRVLLLERHPKNDYINANYIKMVSNIRDGAKPFDRKYISTQGCLPNTVGDFWRMVYQQEVVVIVMTTKETERGRAKCERYWPEKGKVMSADGGEYSIKNIEEQSYHEGEEYSFIRRSLVVKGKKGDRTVTQLQFLGWPDHGCPERADAVLSLLKVADELAVKHPDAPVVVHCSAGIGRTGTFIVLDVILHEIMMNDWDCDIDVARTLMEIREQRQGMVQTEPQYKFIYKALAHYINTAIIENDGSAHFGSTFLSAHTVPMETVL